MNMCAAPNLLQMNPPPAEVKRAGLAHWMSKVLQECDKVRAGFEADPVHDLRVALRRCRSVADGMMALDSRPAWKQMKRTGKQLFGQLGTLRDTHVMVEWIEHLAPENDPAARTLLDFTVAREPALKAAAVSALDNFDRPRWGSWADLLPKRAERVQLDSLVFQHLALQRWTDAYDLHHRALRNRSKTGFHQLRIGLKKFRYTVENFLPRLHEAWGDDLKELQDWLGEVHDLDVLWATALKVHAFPDAESHLRWRTKIEDERGARLQRYRDKMIGPQSLWQAWRAELPRDAEVQVGAMERVRTWAGFLDPDFNHAENVTATALQLYDGLAQNGFASRTRNFRIRVILQAAALAHDVGRAKRERKHQKISARYLRQLDPPLGFQPLELQLAALVARYHRGALPAEGQKRFAALSATQKELVVFLAGILRLAESLQSGHAAPVRGLATRKTGDFLTVWMQRPLADPRAGEKIAGGRYLLELACGCPILVRPISVARDK
jgi:CHAD domain-containing protein